MRFLHTADLHLGKQLNDVSLLDDQRYILEQIAAIARDEDVGAVLIAGDVYQRSSPQAEAMELFGGFISELAGEGRKVFIISGNHDSAQRISYFAPLLKTSGVYVSEAFGGAAQSVELSDRWGKIFVHMLPFLRPSSVKAKLPEAKINSYQDAMEAVLANSPMDANERNILMCHQFITGSVTCESEELSVGGLDNIGAEVFSGFDYVALGHIHGPQSVGSEYIRYAGSPLKYSFSEERHVKSVTIVDIEKKGDITVRAVPLRPKKDVRTLEGMMDELMNMPYSDDYVWITIHDELPPPDAKLSLSVNFPNIMRFSISNSKTRLDMDVTPSASVENKSVGELFSDFYMLQSNGRELTEVHKRLLNKAIEELEGTK